jgi:hypothetical protein
MQLLLYLNSGFDSLTGRHGAVDQRRVHRAAQINKCKSWMLPSGGARGTIRGADWCAVNARCASIDGTPDRRSD